MRRGSTAQLELEANNRKRLLARMLVRQETRQLTHVEIAQRLAEPRNKRGRIDKAKRSVAPNGQPWSKSTIARDLAEIEAGWRLEATRDAATWKARIIAGYDELLAIYWKTGEFEGVERVLVALRKAIGTDSDQVALYEQLQLQLSIAAQRVRAAFSDRPELAQEIYRAFSGNPRADVFSIPDPPPKPRETN